MVSGLSCSVHKEAILTAFYSSAVSRCDRAVPVYAEVAVAIDHDLTYKQKEPIEEVV